MIRVSSVGLAAMLACSAGSSALAFPGPDVTLNEIQQVQRDGPVNVAGTGNIHGYTISSHTCNIGNQNLHWTNFGSPALAMNAYRLHNGRLQQVGLSFCKTACCAAAGGGPCGSCNGVGGNLLGAGCLDVYGSGWNAIQSRLGPRSRINAYTGQIQSFTQSSGNAIFRRCQVKESDMQGITSSALWFVEGLYVADDDAPAGNAMNNATYRRCTVSTGYLWTPTGNNYRYIPAIYAWRDHGGGANVPDNNVVIDFATIPGEGRYYFAHKVTDLGNGRWRYDYAISNFNSDRAGGSFSIPVEPGVNVSGIGFSDVDYHSGEPYSGADWISTVGNGVVSWACPETFAQNANANALRWGTMYNFWFECDQPPAAGNGVMGVFKPGEVNSIDMAVRIPGAPACNPDINGDGSTDQGDVACMILAVSGDTTCTTYDPDFNADGSADQGDVAAIIAAVAGGGCP